jgi:hypothetical protein
VQHNEFHAIGGEMKNNLTNCNKFNVPVHNVEHYHEATNYWNDETDLPSNRFRFAAASYGNSFYIFGGQGPLNDTDANNTYYPLFDNVEAWKDNNADIPIAGAIRMGILLVLIVLCAFMAF